MFTLPRHPNDLMMLVRERNVLSAQTDIRRHAHELMTQRAALLTP